MEFLGQKVYILFLFCWICQIAPDLLPKVGLLRTGDTGVEEREAGEKGLKAISNGGRSLRKVRGCRINNTIFMKQNILYANLSVNYGLHGK